jgi:hypothetical protein
MAELILTSNDYGDLIQRSEYLEHIQDHDKLIVDRVRGLRDEQQATNKKLQGALDSMVDRVLGKLSAMETDIKALKDNPNGFEEGAWVPYLVVKFEVTKTGTNQKVVGEFMPMVANDGPHYGDNIKLFGPGKYHVKYTILPPSENKHAHFGRHTDRLTGVRPWFKPFDVEYDFSYAGLGKKGGY